MSDRYCRLLAIKDCTYSNRPVSDTADCLLASSRQYLFDIRLLQYVQSLTPVDGWKDRPKYVDCYSNGLI